mmetsp:Transcript_20526/g.46579  ORF Transcript_20526/g.46579 Transcript_20526/m.46579 type:complete len:110 (+) Transcript_20526:815-1144(+)
MNPFGITERRFRMHGRTDMSSSESASTTVDFELVVDNLASEQGSLWLCSCNNHVMHPTAKERAQRTASLSQKSGFTPTARKRVTQERHRETHEMVRRSNMVLMSVCVML